MSNESPNNPIDDFLASIEPFEKDSKSTKPKKKKIKERKKSELDEILLAEAFQYIQECEKEMNIEHREEPPKMKQHKPKNSFQKLQIKSTKKRKTKAKRWIKNEMNFKSNDMKNQSKEAYYVDDEKMRGAERLLKHVSNGGEVKQLQEELLLSKKRIEESKRFISDAIKNVNLDDKTLV